MKKIILFAHLLIAFFPLISTANLVTPYSIGPKKGFQEQNISTQNSDRYPWGQKPFTYFADKTPISEVLKDFADQYSVRLEISPNIKTKVDGKLTGETPTIFINSITMSTGLDWYYINSVLYISHKKERVSKAIYLGRRNAADVENMLMNAGILDKRFGWIAMPTENSVLINGPISYIKKIETTLSFLPNETQSLEFGFFPLQHARVQDRVITYRDQRIVVPGLAKIVAELLNSNRTNTQLSNPLNPNPNLNTEQKNVNNSLGPYGAGELKTYDQKNLAASNTFYPTPQSDPSIKVVADTRLNAIIIRAPAEIVRASAALIKRLDVSVPLVQIEAIIVDIDVTKSENLGVNWSLNSPYVSFNTEAGISAEAGVSTILRSQFNFMARINALEKNGNAQVVSRPLILTQNNAAALLDMSHTFFIRNRSERAVETKPVTTGLLLNIIPGVVLNGKNAPQVMMDIQIEDGARTSEMVESIPVIKRSTISTQALVNDAESLLIAGHQVESSEDSSQRIPLLGKIPVLGRLFQKSDKSNRSMKRFFLITPKVIFPNQIPTTQTSAIKTNNERARQMTEEIPSSNDEIQAVDLLPNGRVTNFRYE